MNRSIQGIVIVVGTVLSGCSAFDDLYYVHKNLDVEDMATCSSCDMAAPLTCAAAKGIVGTPLVCVDFASVQDLAKDPKVNGWNFAAGKPTTCPGWESAGVLRLKDFSTFSGDCYFSLPQITNAQIGQYQRLTLSIQQSIDILTGSQDAQIFLDIVAPERLMWRGNGHPIGRPLKVPSQRTTITVDAKRLPDTNGFSWLFELSSSSQAMLQGWTFESIAVIGHE